MSWRSSGRPKSAHLAIPRSSILRRNRRNGRNYGPLRRNRDAGLRHAKKMCRRGHLPAQTTRVCGEGDLARPEILLRLRRPRPPRPRKPNASIAQVDGWGMGEPTGSPCVTTRSSDVAKISSFRRTPPPQLHESAPAPSSPRHRAQGRRSRAPGQNPKLFRWG